MATKILHVIDTTGPGGAETIFLNLISETLNAGWEPIALIRGPGWVEDQLRSLGVVYYIIDCKGSFNFIYLFKLIKLILINKVSIVQSHLLGSNIYASLAGAIAKVDVYSTFHGHVDVSDTEKYRKFKFLCIAVGSRKVICVTEALGKMIKELGYSTLSKKVVVIPNGVSVAGLLEIEKDYQKKPSVIVACLGNVRRAKNYKLAVDLIHCLKSNNYNVKLKIAGDNNNEESSELQKQVERLGLIDDVELLGFVNNVVDFLDKSDVFLMTSSTEGHPLALTQALAAGLPVVSTRSGVEKVIDESLLYLSDEHSVSSLKKAFEHFLSEDVAEIKLRTSVCRQIVRDYFSLGAMTESYMKLYRDEI